MEKRLIISIVTVVMLAGGFLTSNAQETSPPQVKFRNSYYDSRRGEHDSQEIAKGSVIFLGNSITEHGWWDLLFKQKNIVNRGIGGDNTYGMLDRLPDIVASQPEKIFIMAGINDLSVGYSVESTAVNIGRMIDLIKQSAPSCKIYIQSALPVNDDKLAYDYIKGRNPQVRELNDYLRGICDDKGVVFVDVASVMAESCGELKEEYTKDGVHLHPKAYFEWAKYIKKKRYLK